MHHYLELPERPPQGFPHFPALLAVLAELADDDIVVSLDGDDWLAHPGVLTRVQEEHDAGALVTYGSFIYADGRRGFASQLVGPVRASPWVTTHLKTFRAGLAKKIPHAHLQTPDGLWLENARDQALMFPLVDMAGDRARFIPDVLHVYNAANSDEFTKGPSFIMAELEASAYLRGLRL
jgi:hypothetical protein